MKYRGFYISREECSGIERENKNNETVICSGFLYRIYADENMTQELDNFFGLIGFELPDGCMENSDMYVHDVIDCSYKEYCRQRDTLSERIENENSCC